MAQQAPKSISIIIQDSSQAQVILQTYALTGGQWEAAPVPGTIISPTNTPTYVNNAVTVYDTLGGNITLAPASGGSITITWNWPSGSVATSSVTSSGLTGLGVSSTLSGTQTFTPTLQVIVTNASSLAQLLK